jgi:hypothetical protein
MIYLNVLLNFPILVFTECTIRFNVQKFYVLPIECIYVFYMYLGTDTDFFPAQH